MKSEEQIAAEAYNKALLETKDREWKKGDLACHPNEEVLFKIDRFAHGYAIADVLDPETKLVVSTKRFPLSEITDPHLIEGFAREVAWTGKMKSQNMFN